MYFLITFASNNTVISAVRQEQSEWDVQIINITFGWYMFSTGAYLSPPFNHPLSCCACIKNRSEAFLTSPV
jgi:hypothetical protein